MQLEQLIEDYEMKQQLMNEDDDDNIMMQIANLIDDLMKKYFEHLDVNN